MKFNQLVLATLSASVILTSCQVERLDQTEETSLPPQEISLTPFEIQVFANNGVNPLTNDVSKINTNILGVQTEGFAINDYFIPQDQFDDWAELSMEDSDGTQLLSAKLNRDRLNVPRSGKRTVRIGVVNTGPQGLNAKQRNAARDAINRYNALNMGKLRFNITFASGPALMNNNSINTVIFLDRGGNFVGSADGRANFSSRGNPGRLVGLNLRSRRYSRKNLALLIMHELGHTIGVVHSDFRTRNSCTNPLPNNQNSDVNFPTEVIPGTNGSGDFRNSVMRACGFFGFPNSQFRPEDRRAFRRLYNGQGF